MKLSNSMFPEPTSRRLGLKGRTATGPEGTPHATLIELSRETPISLTEAANSLPRRPHISTLHRWRLRGVRGAVLETMMIGGRRFTTAEALERFFVATTAASAGERPAETRTSKQRQRSIECAEQELRKAGV